MEHASYIRRVLATDRNTSVFPNKENLCRGKSEYPWKRQTKSEKSLRIRIFKGKIITVVKPETQLYGRKFLDVKPVLCKPCLDLMRFNEVELSSGLITLN